MGIFSGVRWIAEQVRDRADQELYDDAPVRQALLDLYRDFEAKRITEAEFEEKEARLVARLAAIEEAKQDDDDETDDEETDDEETDDRASR